MKTKRQIALEVLAELFGQDYVDRDRDGLLERFSVVVGDPGMNEIADINDVYSMFGMRR